MGERVRHNQDSRYLPGSSEKRKDTGFREECKLGQFEGGIRGPPVALGLQVPQGGGDREIAFRDEENELKDHLAFIDREIRDARGGEGIMLEEERGDVVKAIRAIEDACACRRDRERIYEHRVESEGEMIKERIRRGVGVTYSVDIHPFVGNHFSSAVGSFCVRSGNSLVAINDNDTVSWIGDEMNRELNVIMLLSRSTKTQERRHLPQYVAKFAVAGSM